VIGELIQTFRNIFQIVFDGVKGNEIRKIKKDLNERTTVGKTIEEIIKSYLISKERTIEIKHNKHIIKVFYNEHPSKIGGHETDGYYSFQIGDNQIGIMPVEITCEKELKGRKKKQLKAFSKDHTTLVIWIYHNREKIEEELKNFESEITEDLNKILIPRALAQYLLLLDGRKFSLLKEIRKNLITDIRTFLNKQAVILFNKWMMKLPIKGKPTIEGEIKISIDDIQSRGEKFLENIFKFLDERSRRSHKTMIEIIKKNLEFLNAPFEEYDIEISLSDIGIIYREILMQLRDRKFCKFTEIEDNKFLLKDNNFNVVNAIELCENIIVNRIEDKFKEKGIKIE